MSWACATQKLSVASAHLESFADNVPYYFTQNDTKNEYEIEDCFRHHSKHDFIQSDDRRCCWIYIGL